MQLEIRRSRASPGTKLQLQRQGFEASQLKRRELLSDAVPRRIVTKSPASDQASAARALIRGAN